MIERKTLLAPAVDDLTRSCQLCEQPALPYTMVQLCRAHWIDFFEEQAENVRAEGAFVTAGTWATNRGGK